MEEKPGETNSSPWVFKLYIVLILVLVVILTMMVVSQRPADVSVPYSIELIEENLGSEGIQYTWHVVVKDQVRIKDLRPLAERLIEEAKKGDSFNALEILVYDYPEYIGHGYTLARIIFAPQGDLRKASLVEVGDYDKMSIQWDLREKIWDNQLSQNEVTIWKAWQVYYNEQLGQGLIPDKSQLDKVIADRYEIEAASVNDIRLRQEYWRYSNFDYITR